MKIILSSNVIKSIVVHALVSWLRERLENMKKYIALLKQYEIMKSASNRIDRQFSISAKQNCYLNIQYWMLKHRMYNAILILGRIYAKIRGQK